MELNQKFELLKSNIKQMGSIAVAFSGGVDSTFLLKVAYDVLGNKAIAITADSEFTPGWEFKEAAEFVEALGVKQVIIDIDVLDEKKITKNPVDRCYHCKYEIFSRIKEKAKKNDIDHVADGTNIDDLSDYRPGMKAINELGIISPLKEAEMTKDDIRNLSKILNLPTWDKPAFACLASRIPYGNEITKEKLEMIDKAEEFLMELGFQQYRVRHHGEIARIEVSKQEKDLFFNEKLMDKVNDKLREIGFKYVTLDLKGYRTGSLNEGVIKN